VRPLARWQPGSYPDLLRPCSERLKLVSKRTKSALVTPGERTSPEPVSVRREGCGKQGEQNPEKQPKGLKESQIAYTQCAAAPHFFPDAWKGPNRFDPNSAITITTIASPNPIEKTCPTALQAAPHCFSSRKDPPPASKPGTHGPGARRSRRRIRRPAGAVPSPEVVTTRAVGAEGGGRDIPLMALRKPPLSSLIQSLV
jgi:hypothetical protein